MTTRDCRVYVRRSAAAREVREPGLGTLTVAKARALALSGHRIRALRPFYAAVYDAQNAYPVAVYQNGTELTGEALVSVLTQPHTGRAKVAAR